ncbi:MAG: hypothetical protein KF864_09615 [Phycisphaeraceae bacterium]|nr:hypothetical protein [Phycisphaeraceae bacterium]
MTKRARSLLWALSLLGAAFAAAALPPSAHAQSSRRASAGEPLNFGRIDIIGGTNPAALLPDDTPQRIAVRLDDSSDALPLLRRFAVALTPDGGPLAAWAQATGPWKPIADREPLPPDHIAVKVLTWQAPIRAAGQSFSINGARHTTQWLLSADAAGVVAPGAWQPTLPPPAASNIPLMQALRLLAQSPVQRWRVRLLIDGLGSIPATPAFDDPILEALASDIEARWRAAFARVYLNDPQTAEELKQRLSLIIDFGNGVFAPAWPADAAATDTLLRDLLSPSPALGAPAARARKFLDQLATSAVWLIDDGGVLSDSGLRVLPTVGVANLTPRPLLATAQFDPVSTPPLMREVRPASTLRIALSPETIAEIDPIVDATVMVGDTRLRLPMTARPLPLSPPGQLCGDLLPDLSLTSWSFGRLETSDPQWSTSAFLFRQSALAGDSRWALLVECRVPSARQDLAGDLVTIYLGPPAKPRSTLTIDATGRVSHLQQSLPSPGPWQPVQVQRTGDKWSFIVPIPPGAAEDHGVLRIALTRRDPRGRRTAWPLPMLPWQQEPARAAFDTRTWYGLPEPQR